MKEIIKYFLNIFAIWISRGAYFFIQKARSKEGLLIVRTDNLGDLIIFSPVLENVSGFFPGLPISLVVSEAAAEFASGLKKRGYKIDKIIVVNRKKFNKNFIYKIRFLLKIRWQNFKIVFSPVFSRESIGDSIVMSSQAFRRIGWQGDICNYSPAIKKLYNRAFTEFILNPLEELKEVEKNIYINKYFENDVVGRSFLPKINILREDIVEAERIKEKYNLKTNKFIIVMPGAGASYRIWPLGRFALIIDYLRSNSFTVIIGGITEENKITKGIISKVIHKDYVINLTGQIPVFTLAALLKQAALYFGSEAGVLHLATAVHTPALCIMGGGHFGRFYPYEDSPLQNIVYDTEMKCRNDNWNCAKNLKPGEPAPCIKAITVEQVQEKINEILKITL